MTKAEFTVGKEERHLVTVEASAVFPRLKVMVDGHQIISTRWSNAPGKTVNFTVGEKEQHQAEVKVSGHLVAKIILLVDGKVEGST